MWCSIPRFEMDTWNWRIGIRSTFGSLLPIERSPKSIATSCMFWNLKMGFESFVGNPHHIERLRTKLRQNRFPHGLIFSGPEGIGKRTCALMLAKSLNCIRAEPADFCGDCAQCRKIDAGTHPDVSLIGIEDEASE